MSTDPNKWLKTLPILNKENSNEKNTLDPNIWLGTISQEKPKQSNTKKISLLIILLIIGLMSVPITKNATRDLQNEISNLRNEISILKLELHQTNLDYEVITSPANLSLLAKENLGTGSVYGDTSIDGVTVGMGYNKTLDNGIFLRAEGMYTQYDGASLTSDTGFNIISLDHLDGVAGKLSVGKSF